MNTSELEQHVKAGWSMDRDEALKYMRSILDTRLANFLLVKDDYDYEETMLYSIDRMYEENSRGLSALMVRKKDVMINARDGLSYFWHLAGKVINE